MAVPLLTPVVPADSLADSEAIPTLPVAVQSVLADVGRRYIHRNDAPGIWSKIAAAGSTKLSFGPGLRAPVSDDAWVGIDRLCRATDDVLTDPQGPYELLDLHFGACTIRDATPNTATRIEDRVLESLAHVPFDFVLGITTVTAATGYYSPKLISAVMPIVSEREQTFHDNPARLVGLLRSFADWGVFPSEMKELTESVLFDWQGIDRIPRNCLPYLAEACFELRLIRTDFGKAVVPKVTELGKDFTFNQAARAAAAIACDDSQAAVNILRAFEADMVDADQDLTHATFLLLREALYVLASSDIGDAEVAKNFLQRVNGERPRSLPKTQSETDPTTPEYRAVANALGNLFDSPTITGRGSGTDSTRVGPLIVDFKIEMYGDRKPIAIQILDPAIHRIGRTITGELRGRMHRRERLVQGSEFEFHGIDIPRNGPITDASVAARLESIFKVA